MAQPVEARTPVSMVQTNGTEVFELDLPGHLTDQFEEIATSAEGSDTDIALPHFVAASPMSYHRGRRSNEDVIEQALGLTTAHNLISAGSGEPVLNINLACMDAGITAPRSGLFVVNDNRAIYGSVSAVVPAKASLSTHLSYVDSDTQVHEHSLRRTTEEANLELLVADHVLATDSPNAAKEAVDKIRHGGVLAVGQSVTHLLRAIAQKEFENPERRQGSMHGASMSLLGVAVLKQLGAELPIGSADLVHEVGVDILATMVVSGLDNEHPGYYSKSIGGVATRLQAIDFTPYDQGQVATRALELMEVKGIYPALADLASSNGSSIDEFAKDQAGSLLKNLMGVQLVQPA